MLILSCDMIRIMKNLCIDISYDFHGSSINLAANKNIIKFNEQINV